MVSYSLFSGYNFLSTGKQDTHHFFWFFWWSNAPEGIRFLRFRRFFSRYVLTRTRKFQTEGNSTNFMNIDYSCNQSLKNTSHSYPRKVKYLLARVKFGLCLIMSPRPADLLYVSNHNRASIVNDGSKN